MENLDDFFKSIEKDFISLTKDEYSKYEKVAEFIKNNKSYELDLKKQFIVK